MITIVTSDRLVVLGDRADKPRVEPLDGLRTVAITFVVLYHLNVPFFSGGFIGVNVFFALSGYLITSILFRERQTSGRIALGSFWRRRIVRLYPTLIVVVVAVVALWPTIAVYSKSNVGSWMDALLALSYTGNIARWLWHRSMGPLAQTWSLATEEQFYLLWPPVVALLAAHGVRCRRIICGLSVLIVGSAAAGWLLYRVPGGGATPDVYFSPVLNVAPLLSGALLAVVLRSSRARELLAGRLGSGFTVIGLSALMLINLTITSGWTKQRIVIDAVLPAVGVASTLLIAGLVHRQTIVSRAFSARPVVWFGRNCSYTLYLCHVMVIALVLPLMPGPFGVAAALVVSAGTSVALHFAVERPIAWLTKRIRTGNHLRSHGSVSGNSAVAFDSTPARDLASLVGTRTLIR